MHYRHTRDSLVGLILCLGKQSEVNDAKVRATNYNSPYKIVFNTFYDTTAPAFAVSSTNAFMCQARFVCEFHLSCHSRDHGYSTVWIHYCWRVGNFELPGKLAPTQHLVPQDVTGSITRDLTGHLCVVLVPVFQMGRTRARDMWNPIPARTGKSIMPQPEIC